MQKQDQKIGAQINLIKLPSNTKYEFELDEETSWLKQILEELNQNAIEAGLEDLLKKSGINLTGSLEKKNKEDMGEFLLISGNLDLTYATECVRTLKPMIMKLSVPFNVCFLDETLGTSEMFAETDQTWVENIVYEVYYYNKRIVNFQEMLHEQVFLNYDQYPVLDAESKLEGIAQESSES
jgi:uncharacterized metal-binding protein YceD (DUF177 family)